MYKIEIERTIEFKQNIFDYIVCGAVTARDIEERDVGYKDLVIMTGYGGVEFSEQIPDYRRYYKKYPLSFKDYIAFFYTQKNNKYFYGTSIPLFILPGNYEAKHFNVKIGPSDYRFNLSGYGYSASWIIEVQVTSVFQSSLEKQIKVERSSGMMPLYIKSQIVFKTRKELNNFKKTDSCSTKNLIPVDSKSI